MKSSYQFKESSLQTRPQGAYYYNNIRFEDKSFWKEVKFIRDTLTEFIQETNGMGFYKVVQIMKMIVTQQNNRNVVH